MEGCSRISKRMLNEKAIEYIDMFSQSGEGIVRLEDVLHGGKHCIIHRGAEHVFKTNKDAYEFMANAVKESGRE